MEPSKYFDKSDLEMIKKLKNKFVKAQCYDTAVILKDLEKSLMSKIQEDEKDEKITLEALPSYSKEQVKRLMDLSVKDHEEEIIRLKGKLEHSEKTVRLNEIKIKELEDIVLKTANLAISSTSLSEKYMKSF